MNKKRLIHGFATVYIVAAILVAHSSLAAIEETAAARSDRQAEVGAPAIVVRDHQRLVEPDPQEYNRHQHALHTDRASRADDANGASRADGADGASEGQATETEGKEATRPRDADRAARAGYTVRFWSSTSCAACQRYKRSELPALLRMGYEVEVLDYYTDDPPDDIATLPTLQLVYKGEVIESETYWKAKDIDKYVSNHRKLKDK